MHGRVKVKEKSEIEFEKKRKYQEKAIQFKNGQDLCLKSKAQNDYNKEIMRITWDLIATNPDVYSLWNMRKENIMIQKERYDNQLNELKSLLNLQNESTGNDDENKKILTEEELTNQFQKLCDDELELTGTALLKNSKSYSAWQHRLWILGLIPKPNFEREFYLNEAYLQKDGRNLHCWHYRTNLCNISGRKIEDEIAFSLDRIKDNLSAFSYSTLYYRSLILTRASEQKAGIFDFSKSWSDEYTLIENALFTEPNDQALWFYLRWLLLTNFGQCLSLNCEQSNEPILTKVLLNRKNHFLIFYFNKVTKVFPFDKIELITDSNSSTVIRSDQVRSVVYKPSKLWYFQLENVDGLNELRIENQSDLNLQLVNMNNYQVWTDKSIEQTANLSSSPQMRIHDEQLNSLLTLKELEPENKWLNLILSYFENTDQLQILDDLIRLDGLRKNYYEDQKSKIKLEKFATNLQPDQSGLDLINQQISVFYIPEPFAHLLSINLTGNSLRCLSSNLNSLVSVEDLIIDDNLVNKVQKTFKLPSLRTLSLRNNKITKYSGLEHLINCPNLKMIHLSNNNITDKDLEIFKIKAIHYEL